MTRTPRRVAVLAAGLLLALLAARASAGEAPPVEPERAERVAREVVDELGLDEPPDTQPPQEVPGGSAFGAVGQLLAYVVVGAAAAGIAYAIVALVRSGRGRRAGDDETGDDEVGVEIGAAVAEDDIAALSAAQWRERAAAAEADGRYADAVRFLHYAGLLGLDEDGLVEFEPGRPNGDYVRLVARLAPGSAPGDLGHLNRLMEDATFGKYEMDRAAVEWSRSGWARVHDAFAPGATV